MDTHRDPRSPRPPSGGEELTLAALEVPAVRDDRYQRPRLHGEGGVGRVYIAFDAVLHREVAIKEIRPELAHHAEARLRLLREVQITGQLEHPGIVPVYDLARREGEDTPFYTMRLLRGETLGRAIAGYHERRRADRADPLELPRLLGFVIGICNAMSYAHSRRVLHRDLKPENVMLGHFGEVVLLDWGLAKLTTDDEPRSTDEVRTAVGVTPAARPQDTAAGLVVGTPAYMAPEQACGTVDAIGTQTDVYGLGAILFELLTGSAPHIGDDTDKVLTSIVSGVTPRARDREASAPAALDAICARAMAARPDRRYPSASALADDLQRYLADEPVLAYRESPGRRVGRWMRRHRAWTMAGAAALFLISAVVTVAAIRLAAMAGRERTARLATERTREEGIRVAAKFAARAVANEIDLRWRVLEAEARSAYLRRALARLGAAASIDDHPDLPRVQRWLELRHAEHQGMAKATSWFVTDNRGRHLGRSPLDASIVGRSFAFRDYFHGAGRDDPPTAAPRPPIREPHRSIVFQSQASDRFIVAFSTAVWFDPDAPDGDVAGVLAMTVELGRFGELQTDLGGSQIAVLVETKEDWIEGVGRTGLVLHHPLQHETGGEAGPTGRLHRIPVVRVDGLRALRAAELEQRRERERGGWVEAASTRRSPQVWGLDTSYRDPLGGADEAPWLAAFEPVVVDGRAAPLRDTGWIVVVQERNEPGDR